MAKHAPKCGCSVAAAALTLLLNAGATLAQEDLDFLKEPDAASQPAPESTAPPPAESAAEGQSTPATSASDAGTNPDPAPASASDTAVTATAPAAAPPAEPPAAKRGKNRLIEEIVVTAQKREENLQDVPISIQAFSADTLDAKGIEDPRALQLSTPGLQYGTFVGYSLIYIRGVGTDAFIPSSDASVATYIDNVYYPFGHGLASALGSIERVEVLKGPQGTLFGRNSTGGAIHIITKQPGPELKTEILASRESDDKANVRLYTNIPLSDTFAISLAGLSYREDNYYTLSADSTRAPLPTTTSRAFSVKAGWTPIDDLKMVLGYTYINSSGITSLPAYDIKPAGRSAGVTQAPDYQTGESAPTYIDSQGRVLTGDIKYSLPWFDLRAIGGYQKIDSPALADYDGSSANVASFEATGQFADVKTGEFQILSNKNGSTPDWLTWLGGLYYINSSAGYDPLFFTGGQGSLTNDSGILTSISTATGIPLQTLANGGFSLHLVGVLDTRSTAAFFQTTADLTDWLALTIGGRYQTETRTLVKSTTGVAPNPDDRSTVVPLFDFNSAAFGNNGPRSEHSSNFSPKAVLDVKFGEGSLAYLSYAKGFKSGTYNIIAIYQPTQYVEPEVVTTFELGYKGTLLDGALRFNTAVFQNRINKLQVQTISLTSGGAVRFETAGSARIRGADFDLTWQVLPNALPGLVFTGGGAYLDGVYTSYQKGSGFDETTGVFFDGTVFPTRDFTGNRLVRTPRFSGNAGLSYSMEIGSGSLEFGGDVYYNSGIFFSAQNTKAASEGSYHLFNARVSYLYEPWNVRLSGFGKNINSAKYHYTIQDLDFGTAKLLAPPSTYGVKVQWDF